MKDSLDFSWIANDTTPKLTWDDILKPSGVADQTFGVVTPDPRDKPVKSDTYIGIIEGVALVVVVFFSYVFFSQK